MKKTIVFTLLATALFASCEESNREQEVIEVVTDTTLDTTPNTPDTLVSKPLHFIPVKEQNESILGYYVGDFRAQKYAEGKNPTIVNKISIVIDSVKDTTIYGHSIVAGNSQVFVGGYTSPSDSVITFTGKEPGNDQYDGVFTASLNTNTKILTGTWEAYNKSLAVTKRSYTLTKKVFRYNPSLELPRDMEWTQLYNGEHFTKEFGEWESTTADVLKVNPSTTVLTKKDVENMFQGDLEVLRNSIYARHGYSFKNRRMRYVFDKVDWYIPVSNDIRLALTDIEKKNVDLIKRYEKHAESYYDSYGR